MVDKKLSEFDSVSTGDVSYFPVLDGNTKNAKLPATKAMPWTNCITEIKQDIKLSLNNGTLTLQAGSKVYVPNGSGVFDVVTVSSDINLSQSWGESADCLLFLYGGSTLNVMPPSRCSSGTSDSISGSDHFYYNTTNNTLRFIESSGSARSTSVSLPIAIVKMSGSGANVSSVENIFNGFGYIGSTSFCLPGVKGLIPNGRNADGSLKNIAFENLSVKTFGYNLTGTFNLIVNSSEMVYSGDLSYDFNKNINTDYGTLRLHIKLATVNLSSGVITSFKSDGQFACVNYNEFKATKDDMMTLSTSQNVTANKTYYGVQNFYGRNRAVFLQSEIDSTVNPSSAKYGGALNLCDKNGVSIGYMDSTQYTSGQIYSRLGVTMLTSGGSRIYPYLNACGDKDGNQWAEAPTPSAVTDNTNKIATTQWFNNKVKVVSALPANPVNGVFYYVTD